MKEKFSDNFLISRQKMAIIGFLIILFSPLPAGLVYGFFCWRQPEMKKDGKLMIIFSLFWGAVSLSLARKYFGY
ncbi:MAG: hypothetical protein PHW15_01450 [Patescibacteria group bacterium]|jgi:hypothetical protein|nr:hypothetical protein [Patescibacteria group bacterium]MDD5173064.1 hypothetical protein [Patescibacteria group bacterium]